MRSVAAGLGVLPRNPKWTSKGSLEVDLFAASRADIELTLAALEPLGRIEFAKDLGASVPYRSREEAFGEARDLFNAERYWEAHEVMEGVWRVLEGPEKLLVQGMILVCAAFVHHQKGEDGVGIGVLNRAAGQLVWPRGRYYGIDVERLKSSVEKIVGTKSFSLFVV